MSINTPSHTTDTVAGWRWANHTDVHAQMADMIYGYFVSQTVRAIADLSVADHLAAGPMSGRELAAREQCDAATMRRLLRGAVALRLVRPDEGGRFHSTDLLATLRRDAARSLRGMALGATNTSHWAP
jgi:hypothetical protein